MEELGFSDEQMDRARKYLTVDLTFLLNVGIDVPADWVPQAGPLDWPVPGDYTITSKLFDYGALLFVNFHPVILSGCLDEILSDLDGFREKTVIEVTESSRLKLRRCVYDKLKEKGVRIALDDVGVGDRSFSSICDVEVDYLKVDKGVVRGISSGNGNANKYKFLLTFLAEFGEKSGARVITEGVETSEQVSLTEKIGIELMQGFYFSKPKPAEYWVKHNNVI
ncbi:MAG: Cyclic di-GMP phosphodiesterase YahA [Pelotomaculum sp. PtaB.Bin104]|nr:MAG: Cyclic di-GMP phosphodiesterase YahA [Pelotomaculum sp. PtaB.Bin104]